MLLLFSFVITIGAFIVAFREVVSGESLLIMNTLPGVNLSKAHHPVGLLLGLGFPYVNILVLCFLVLAYLRGFRPGDTEL